MAGDAEDDGLEWFRRIPYNFPPRSIRRAALGCTTAGGDAECRDGLTYLTGGGEWRTDWDRNTAIDFRWCTALDAATPEAP